MPATLNQTRLGVAVVGLGVGEQHARAFLATQPCHLAWLYDLDGEKSKRLTQALGGGAVASNVREILEDPEVQVVSIASYDDEHFEHVLAALKARKHVLAEKPLCRSVAELRQIKEAWLSSGPRHLTSNLVLRGAPLYQWLKRAIASGELGQLYAFDGEYLYGRLHKITDGWRKDIQDYSVMQGGGIHLVDLMLWLTGQRPVRVMAAGNRLCTEGTAFRSNDFLAATFTFPSGLIGRVTANFGCVHRHQHVVRVFGTNGTFIYDDEGPRLSLSRDPEVPAHRLPLATVPPSKGVLVPDFVRAIVTGEDPRAHTQHEFDVISACVAADEACARDSSVEVTYV